jgi:two-component system chemotaxis response regulator CheY
MTKVMVVDDTQFMRRRISNLLMDNDYQVLEAQNGEDAVRMYQNTQPDIVLMDITMPQMDGLMALSKIREFDPQARIIMLTAIGQQATALEAIQKGAKDFLVKPCDTVQVLKALAKALK